MGRPKQGAIIIKTIQDLMSAAKRELDVLNKLTPIKETERKLWIGQVLEDIEITEKTTLSKLQKEFE